ncbi:MAG: HAMP domain-containing protein [Hydrogenophaga sp.]|uniref:ATP-binding protein n=1 Tax=Hydrogenophaga sp. TaxID=1904254 RepID=UPI0025BC9BFB|nr:ATP-binding protein [Hydrogenophaga sp.]MBT9552341.1 HAMP domain-containing protein [Hydrogenophaga sp.]
MMKRWRERLGRLDSLFLRLFLLMWVTLVLSQLVAFSVVSPVGTQWVGRLSTDGAAALPPLPSLPPGNPLTGDGLRPPGLAWRPSVPPMFGPDGERLPDGEGMPARALWLDYALRALLIGVGAAIGARWLSVPMRRLAQASTTLSKGLAEGRDLPALDDAHGTVEVRDSARAFNRMAQALKHQFDQRSLHMAAVSHDLRTPLTRLRLRLEQLPSDAARAAGADIRAMDELIDASLAVVREQATGTGPALLDLGALLQSLTDDLAEQGLPVTLAGDAEVAPALRVRAHPASLRRVVDNLVDNALRHGGVARLGCWRVGGWAEVTVDDDGPGIAPAQLERVFQPWVRLPDGPGANSGGSGLGLAIARDLAQREGGTLTLANRAEGGLRARLQLKVE